MHALTRGLRGLAIGALAVMAAAVPATAAGPADQLVGYWKSTSGTAITVSYGNDDKHVSIEVHPGRGKPPMSYTATITAAGTFTYKWGNQTITGLYDAHYDDIQVRTPSGSWKALWRRTTFGTDGMGKPLVEKGYKLDKQGRLVRVDAQGRVLLRKWP